MLSNDCEPQAAAAATDCPIDGRALLSACARDPGILVSRVFAHMLELRRREEGFAIAPFQGLDAAQLGQLLDRHFPAARRLFRLDADAEARLPADEFADLLQLLREHRADDAVETDWLACAVAAACAGEEHLYQDLGLPDRRDLSELLRSRFTALFKKNVHDMRWKKFFYKQLCDRQGLNLCRAPICTVCSDYQNCFGPEVPDSPAWRARP